MASSLRPNVDLLPYPSAVEPGPRRVLAGTPNRVQGLCSERLRRAVARLPDRGLVIDFEVAQAGRPVPMLDDSYEYRIVFGETVAVRSATEWGAIAALATLTQLIAGGELAVSQVRDAPRYPWRGVMIDTVRHFISLETLRRTLDVMAFYKLNVLHLHLTDDQGFRFRSEAYPELASAEAYSTTELRELVDYAADRAIRIVPELDVPGHATSWLAAHPDWGVDDIEVDGPSPRFGVHDVCLDIDNDDVRVAIDLLLGEFADVFPDGFVHFGGDEVGRDCTAFYQHVVGVIADLGKRAIGWDECLHDGLGENAVIEAWRGIGARDAALRAGHDCVVAAPYYLDLSYPMDVHYAFDPETATAANERDLLDHPRLAHVRKGLEWMSDFGRHPDLCGTSPGRVLGGEACLWSELVTDSLLDTRLWSRMPAIAERLWNGSRSDVADIYGHVASTRATLAGLGMLAEDHVALLDSFPDLAPLIEMLEPVKWYLRLLGVREFRRRVSGLGSSGDARPYDTATHLDRIVDLLPPESLASRRAEADLAAGATMDRWITGWRQQRVALERRAELRGELQAVSQALANVADFLDGRTSVDIDNLEGPFGEYLLPIAHAAARAPRISREKARTDLARTALTAWHLDAAEIQVIHGGHINDTYRVDERYVLQRLNPAVFGNPEALTRNLDRAVAHEGGNLLLAPIPTDANKHVAVSASGDVWRLFPHLPSRNFGTLPEELLNAAGEAFGGFLAAFADFDGEPEPVIEGFHDLGFYLERLDASPVGDVGTTLGTINGLRTKFQPGTPQRVIHGDCKVNNLLFHPTRDAVVAIIDLDTLMWGDPAWDFGDLVRSAFAGSEETNAAMPFCPARFELLARGFLSAYGDVDDIARFAAAPAYMSYMLSVRFLTDHLEGDVYFKVDKRGDNLARARSQLELAEHFATVEDDIADIIERIQR